MTRAKGIPAPSVRRLRLTPRLPRSVGLAPVAAPQIRGFRHHPIDGLPFPLDADQLIILLQTRLPKRASTHLPVPILESDHEPLNWLPVRAVTRSIECLFAGHKPLLQRLVGQASGGGPFCMRGGGRDQGLHPLPQLVTDAPSGGYVASVAPSLVLVFIVPQVSG